MYITKSLLGIKKMDKIPANTFLRPKIKNINGIRTLIYFLTERQLFIF